MNRKYAPCDFCSYYLPFDEKEFFLSHQHLCEKRIDMISVLNNFYDRLHGDNVKSYCSFFLYKERGKLLYYDKLKVAYDNYKYLQLDFAF